VTKKGGVHGVGKKKSEGEIGKCEKIHKKMKEKIQPSAGK
jgi:hypothetical protein